MDVALWVSSGFATGLFIGFAGAVAVLRLAVLEEVRRGVDAMLANRPAGDEPNGKPKHRTMWSR